MITLPQAKGRDYWILGLGQSGLAAARSLSSSGAQVYVWDDKEKSRDAAAAAGYTVRDPAQSDLTGAAALVLAPGIPLTHPAPHAAVLCARAAGVPVLGDVELLFQACPQARYVAITGTNGKSTTTALIAHILDKAKTKVQVGGNLGTPVMTFDPMGPDGVFVLELSSFQLDLIHTNPIEVAVLLNLTPDHLNRHGDMAGYGAVKERIFSHEGPQTCIIGVDEPETAAIADRTARLPDHHVVPVSVTRALDHGYTVQGGHLMHAGAPVMKLDDITALPGPHNAQNMAAAYAASRALGLPHAAIEQGIRSFPGLAHRQQCVAVQDGVRFVNDSKATNADAAAKALACYHAIYWIIGGLPKAGGLAGLESFAPRIRHAFIIGAASDDFAQWCAGQNIPHSLCGTLDKAVDAATTHAYRDASCTATEEPVVLLSPACASFDQFSGFEERGDVFADTVRAALARRKEGPCQP